MDGEFIFGFQDKSVPRAQDWDAMSDLSDPEEILSKIEDDVPDMWCARVPLISGY